MGYLFHVPKIVMDAHMTFGVCHCAIGLVDDHFRYVYPGEDLFLKLEWHKSFYRGSVGFLNNSSIVIPPASTLYSERFIRSIQEEDAFYLGYENKQKIVQVVGNSNDKIVASFPLAFYNEPPLDTPAGKLNFAVATYSNATVHFLSLVRAIEFLTRYVAHPTKVHPEIARIYGSENRIVNFHVGGDNEDVFIQAVAKSLNDSLVYITFGLYPLPTPSRVAK